MKPSPSSVTQKRFAIDNSVFCFNSKKFSFAHLKPLPFTKKLANVVYYGSGKIFCYISYRNNEFPQIMMYNLNRIYPEFDRYAFNRQVEQWAISKHKGKIKQITENYNFDPDKQKLITIEEIVDKAAKKNQSKRNSIEENMQVRMLNNLILQELQTLTNGDSLEIQGPSFENLKMEELKESMTYNTIGEVQDPGSINRDGLYDVSSNSSRGDTEQEEDID